MKALFLNPQSVFSPSVLALVLRFSLGVVFFAHGAQKVLGWFGGYGLEGTTGWMNSQLGIPYLFAYLACFTEFVGAIFLIFGFLTRLSALSLAGTMLVAMLTANTGFFSPDGIEFPLSLFALSIASFLTGAGRYSLDYVLFSSRKKQAVANA